MTSRTRVFLAGALLCAATAAGAAQPPASPPARGNPAMAGMDPASMQMHQAMMEGMQHMHAMQPSGDPDRDFATLMEHHHAQAVKMTEAYLKGAKDPQLKAWARKTLADEQEELKELRALNVTARTSRQAESKRR